MTQYIDKSALSAEIDKRKNLCEKIVLDLRTEENKDYYQGKAEAYKETLDLLATLEVKEVDLEKELDEYTADNFWALKGNNESPYLLDKDDMLKVAKHFYVLGLNKERNKL